MRISDWSSDVCSSDLSRAAGDALDDRDRQAVLDQDGALFDVRLEIAGYALRLEKAAPLPDGVRIKAEFGHVLGEAAPGIRSAERVHQPARQPAERHAAADVAGREPAALLRSEEHTSELQSLIRISYAVF